MRDTHRVDDDGVEWRLSDYGFITWRQFANSACHGGGCVMGGVRCQRCEHPGHPLNLLDDPEAWEPARAEDYVKLAAMGKLEN